MPYAHFQIPVQGGEEEEHFNQFIQRHRVIKLEKHFVPAGADSFWAYHLQYTTESATPGPSAASRYPSGQKPLVDYQEILNEDDFTLFLQLKEWRKERAAKLKVEAYTIFTNAQLAEIAERRCDDKYLC